MARVGTVPLRVALLHCLCHGEEGAAMLQVKMAPPGYSHSRYGPHASISANPGLHKWGHPEGGWGYLLWPVPTGTEHLDMLTPWPLNVGPPCWAGPMASEDSPLWCYVDCPIMWMGHYTLRQVSIKGYSMFPHPSIGPLLSQTQSPSPEASRHEGTKAPQWCGCSTVCPSWAQSTGPVQGWEHLCTPPRVEGWTPIHSLSRHEHSHKRDEPPRHSWVSTVVVIPPVYTEATSAKWPQEGSSMRHFHPMHRHSHSRSGQQQQHQSLPQRDPTQSKVHPWTPSRSPSRHVSPLLILPCSQLIDG